MYYHKLNLIIRKLAKEHIEADVEVPELIPNFQQFYRKGCKGFSFVIWFLVTVTAVSLCSYQIFNRIVYFSSWPVKVDARITEELTGDFPAIILVALYTDKSQELKNAIREKFKLTTNCKQIPNFYVDNKTDISLAWDAVSVQPMINNTSFRKVEKKKKYVLSVEDVHSLVGIQTIVENVEKVPIEPQDMIEIKFNVETDKQHGETDVFVVYLQPKQKISVFTDYSMLRFIDKFKNMYVQYTFKQYKFLNRKHIPCVEEQEEKKCRQNCFVKGIEDDIQPSCQLPFLPKRIRKNCILSDLTCDYVKAISKKLTKLNPHYSCHCARACNKIAFNTHIHYTDHIDKSLTVSSHSNLILTLSEYFSYDIITLLCDIGGYLGLYIGISCIALMEIVISNIQKHQKIIEKSKEKKSQFRRRVERIIDKFIARKKNNQGFVDTLQTNLNVMKVIKILFVFACTCLSLHIIIVRIICYFQYPVSTFIEVVEDQFVHIPAIVVCTDTSDVREEKQKIIESKTLNNSCAVDLSIAELLDEPSKFAHNASGLWQESNIDKFYTMASLGYSATYINNNYGTKTPLSTIFGNCTKVQTGEMEYAPASGYFLTIEEVTAEGCNSHSKIFLTPAETRIDFQASWIVPHTTWTYVSFTRQMFYRLNTLTNPCTDLTEFRKCEENCLERKLDELNIKCRLPFIKSSSLPLCDTSISAKQVIQSYLKIYSGNVNAQRDCKCRPACELDFHISNVIYDQTFRDLIEGGFVLSLNELESNFREIFREELKLPLIKLVCDVGSISGFYLGISFFSFLKQIPKISHFFNSYGKRKSVFKI